MIALVEKHGDIKMSASQLASIFGMLKKEDEAEELVKKIESLDAPIMPQVFPFVVNDFVSSEHNLKSFFVGSRDR